MPIALLIALVLALGGGTSFAAEKALPGEVLYPVKTNINESVRATLALSEKDKAELQTKLAQLRLEEAEKLAIKGKLDGKIRIKIEEKLKKHIDKVEEKVFKIEAESGLESVEKVTADLEASLLAHKQILEKLGSETNEELKMLKKTVEQESASVAQVRKEVETQIFKKEEKIKEDKLKEDKLKEDKLKEDKLKEDKLKEDKLKEDKLKEDKLKEDKLKEDKLKEDKLKEDKLKEKLN